MTPIIYDALLLISFGGPEGPYDVMPFLRNVTRGRNISDDRLNEVAHHYELFGGVSPINQQNRDLLKALKAELSSSGKELPVYWGNRNWHPLLVDTLKQMERDGIKNVIAIATSAYPSYSGCRQYLEDIDSAREAVGDGAPVVHKLKVFFQSPGFIEANADRLRSAIAELGSSAKNVPVAFTAHSVPQAMASSCNYATALAETAAKVASANDVTEWKVVYQSRSGPPSQPWLEPDICDYLRSLHGQGIRELIIAPIGFVSDHMEVIYDLDVDAKEICNELGIRMVRAKTVGTHPSFVGALKDLIVEKLESSGSATENPDFCVATCCPSGRPAMPATAAKLSG